MLEPPAWATTSATKRLQADFKALLKVQNSEPLHELGWYIDPNLVTNMYQWIVELHSFDPTLPLAKDMKAKGFKSIVLELRFGKDYPMSPPFVRVIRPRFLGFQQGGGGHVTAGGALCMEVSETPFYISTFILTTSSSLQTTAGAPFPPLNPFSYKSELPSPALNPSQLDLKTAPELTMALERRWKHTSAHATSMDGQSLQGSRRWRWAVPLSRVSCPTKRGNFSGAIGV
jgi:ubiquitin-protein ligase